MKLNFSDRGFWIGTVYCVLAALGWAVIGPVSRVCFAEGMDPSTVAFWRMAISGSVFWRTRWSSAACIPGSAIW